MNALELAKYLDRLNGYQDMPQMVLEITQPSANMLRKQQAEIEALKTEPPHKNLSDEEIKDLIVQHIQTWNSLDSIIDFARAILKKAMTK